MWRVLNLLFHLAVGSTYITLALIFSPVFYVYVEDGRWKYSLVLLAVASVVYYYTNIFYFFLVLLGVPVIIAYCFVVLFGCALMASGGG